MQSYLTEFSVLREQSRDATQNLDDEADNWHPFLKVTNSITGENHSESRFRQIR